MTIQLPDASGSAPGHYVETPGFPMSTAGSPPDLLVLDPETLAAIQAALANLSIG